MKNLYNRLFILIYIAVRAAARVESVGGRVVFNRGMAINTSCSEEEIDTVDERLQSVVSPLHQPHHLRTTTITKTELPICDYDYCHDFAEGTCYTPMCRHDDDVSPIPSKDQQHANDALIETDLKQECRQIKSYMLMFVKENILTNSLSTSCKSALGKRVDVQCHILDSQVLHLRDFVTG